MNMGLNKSRYLKPATGNMYGFVTHMWSPLRGRCPHECRYCYVVKMAEKFGSELKGAYVDERHFVGLGEGNTIFVCHMSDLFAEAIPSEWIEEVIDYCRKYPDNTYLFQTKNPARFKAFGLHELKNAILTTTVETDIEAGYQEKVSQAPLPRSRLVHVGIPIQGEWLVTTEPILKFSEEFARLLINANPDMIAVGADSKQCHLEEPSPDEIRKLIREIRRSSDIKIFIKRNLRRLVPEYKEGWLDET